MTLKYLWIGFWALLCSCEFFSEDYSAELKFPEIPEGWGESAESRGESVEGLGAVEAWEVEWLGYGDGISRRRVEAGEVLRLRLGKEAVVVIVARPIFSGMGCGFECGEAGGGEGRFFRPAGFYMGVDRRNEVWKEGIVGRAVLRWEDGAAARFLLDLEMAGVGAGLVNFERLRVGMRERSKGAPWDLDFRRLMDNFVLGKLWVYSFRLRERVEVGVDFPPGFWLGEYVLSEPLVVEEDGWEGDMVVGYHRFVRMGDLSLVAVEVDSRGDSRIFIQ